MAAAAASALECLAVSPERLKLWLQPEGQAGLLAAALNHEDATVRSRALALTVNFAAASPEAAEIVLASGEPSIKHLRQFRVAVLLSDLCRKVMARHQSMAL